MKEKTRKLIMWVMLGLSLIGGIFAVIHATGSDPKNMLEAGSMQEIGNQFSGMYDITYFMLVAIFAIAIIAILYFVFRQFFNNFKDDRKKAIKALAIIGLAIVVCLVSFLLATGTDVSQALLDKNNLTVATSKWIGAACILVYILVIGAAAAIVYVEVSKLFKKK